MLKKSVLKLPRKNILEKTLKKLKINGSFTELLLYQREEKYVGTFTTKSFSDSLNFKISSFGGILRGRTERSSGFGRGCGSW